MFAKNRKNQLVCGGLLLTLAGCSSIGSGWDNTVDFIFGPDDEANQRQEKAAELVAEAAGSTKPDQAVVGNFGLDVEARTSWGVFSEAQWAGVQGGYYRGQWCSSPIHKLAVCEYGVEEAGRESKGSRGFESGSRVHGM